MGQKDDDGGGRKRRERRLPRLSVLRSAQAVFGNSVINCVVLDMSADGARVSFGTPVALPEELSLRLRDGAAYPARRRWTRGTQAGLMFTEPAAASSDEGQLRRAGEALRAIRSAGLGRCFAILRAERFFGNEALRQAAEAAEAAHSRLDAVLAPHAGRPVHDGPGLGEGE